MASIFINCPYWTIISAAARYYFYSSPLWRVGLVKRCFRRGRSANLFASRERETRRLAESLARISFRFLVGRVGPMASDEPAGLTYLTRLPSGSVLGIAREHHRVSYVPFLRHPCSSSPRLSFRSRPSASLPTRLPLALAIDDFFSREFDSRRFVIQCSQRSSRAQRGFARQYNVFVTMT